MSIATAGADTSDSGGTAVPASGSNNVKGAYVELLASTAAAYDGVLCGLGAPTSLIVEFLVDLATGAAGAETVVLANVNFGESQARYWAITSFPLGIASSTRVAARQQCTNGAQTLDCVLHLWQLGTTVPGGCTAVDTYGASTTDSGGVSVDPGGSANTKGTYSEITASTSAATEQVTVVIGNQLNGVRTNARWLLDIATGAAAAETVVFADIEAVAAAVDDRVHPHYLPSVPLVIANATRIAARAQCDITDAADRLLDVLVYAARGADAIGGGGGGGGLKLVGPGGLAG